MTLQDPNWMTFGGEPITGRTPTRVRVISSTPGLQLSSAQQAFAAQAYRAFCIGVRTSAIPGGYHVRRLVASDGTEVSMESNNGVHRVVVRPAGGGEAVTEIYPSGIGVALTAIDGSLVEELTLQVGEDKFIPQPMILRPTGKPGAGNNTWRVEKVRQLVGGNVLWTDNKKRWLSIYRADGQGGVQSGTKQINTDWTPATNGRIPSGYTPPGEFQFASLTRYVMANNETVKLRVVSSALPPAIYKHDGIQFMFSLDPAGAGALNLNISTAKAVPGLNGLPAPVETDSNAIQVYKTTLYAPDAGASFGMTKGAISPSGRVVAMPYFLSGASTTTKWAKIVLTAEKDALGELVIGASLTVHDIPAAPAATNTLSGAVAGSYSFQPPEFSGSVATSWGKVNAGSATLDMSYESTTETRQLNQVFFLEDDIPIIEYEATSTQIVGSLDLEDGLASGMERNIYDRWGDPISPQLVNYPTGNLRTGNSVRSFLSSRKLVSQKLSDLPAVVSEIVLTQEVHNMTVDSSAVAGSRDESNDPADVVVTGEVSAAVSRRSAVLLATSRRMGFVLTLEAEASDEFSVTVDNPPTTTASYANSAIPGAVKLVFRVNGVTLREVPVESTGSPSVEWRAGYVMGAIVPPTPTFGTVPAGGTPVTLAGPHPTDSFYYPESLNYSAVITSALTAGVEQTAGLLAVELPRERDAPEVHMAEDPRTGFCVVQILWRNPFVYSEIRKCEIYAVDDAHVREISEVIQDAPLDARIWPGAQLSSLVSI